MTKCFEVSVESGVAHIQLCRPDELNTMIEEFWFELPELIRSLDESGTVRAMVISSTGKHFSAGMDLSVFSGDGGLLGGSGVTEQGRQRASLFQLVLQLQDSFTSLEKARVPVLAAVQGGCIGGAVDMVCAADMRYASADAFFCVQEINIGMTADVGTLQRLPKIIPDGVARQLAYTGERMPASRALEVGLVNHVFENHEALVDGVLEIARTIAAKSPLAIWGTKEAMTYARDHSVTDSLRQMAAWQSGMFQPGDMIECFAAKAEGREPVFEGLPARQPR